MNAHGFLREYSQNKTAIWSDGGPVSGAAAPGTGRKNAKSRYVLKKTV